jgi:hypothetical protein
MLYAITHHDTSQPLKLYGQIIGLDSLLHKSNKRIENLERLLTAYKRYAIKKAMDTNDMLAPGDEETVNIVTVHKINKKLFDNEHFDMERYLIESITNSVNMFLIKNIIGIDSIKKFLADPNTRKRIKELTL